MTERLFRAPGLALVMCMLLTFMPVGTPIQAEEWIHVQNASQGYALSCPKDAVVQRYDPEGVLRIEVRDSFFLTIHMYENSDHLSAQEWADMTIVNGQVEDDYKVGPPALVISRGKTSIQDQPAETLLLVSGGALSRRTILATAQRLYRIDYPVGDEEGERIFESIVASFELGDFLNDEGITVLTADHQSIASLPVPAYSQNDTRWKCDQLGTCTCNFGTCAGITYTTIGDGGCHITSIAMLFDYYSSSLTTPPALNTCLRDNGQYGTAAGFCTSGYCGIDHPSSPCIPTGVTFEGVSYDKNILDQDLSNGFPAVGRRYDDGHSVAIIGKNGSNYQIIDPWDGAQKEVAPSWIYYFWRYHGPVGTCCGCLPASCCSGAQAQACSSSSEFRWTDSGNSNPATSTPCTASGARENIDTTETAALPGKEEELDITDETASWDAELPITTTASITEPMEASPEGTDPIDSPATTSIPAQRAPVEPQRTPPTSTSYRIPKSVFGSGGGAKTSTHYVMNTTQGQSTDLSRRTSTSYVLTPGYWSRGTFITAQFEVYLPLVTRNH